MRSHISNKSALLFFSYYIVLRYDCVEELIEDGEMAVRVATCLALLPRDLDKWAALCVSRQSERDEPCRKSSKDGSLSLACA